MFVRVQAHEMKPLMNCVAVANLVSGAPVKYEAPKHLNYANANSDYIVVAAENFNGLNAVIEPTDAYFDKIKEGDLCLRFPFEVGDVIATTEVEAPESGELVGIGMHVENGKFVEGFDGDNPEYVCLGIYDNPWGLEMYKIERVSVNRGRSIET